MNESDQSVRRRTESVISQFLHGLGRNCLALEDRTDLHRDLDCTSDEGVLLVIELGEEFNVELPHEFNAVVDESGRRGRTFLELVNKVQAFVGVSETPT